MNDASTADFPSERLRRWHATGEFLGFGSERIFYRRSANWHDSALPVLVLVHGFPTSSFDWHAVWDGLSGHFRLLAPDLLGFGFSSKPAAHAYSLVEQADVVEAVVAVAGGDVCHLLAHDYGDSVAQELLARHGERHARRAPNWLRSVVLLNGGLFPETHRARPVQRLLLSPLGPLLARLLDRRRFGRSFSAVFSAQHRPSEAELDEFWALIARDDGQLLAPRLLSYMPERRRHRERWLRALVDSAIPVRLINGLDDPVSGAHMVARYRELIPHPDVIELEGIGHYPQVEAAQEVIAAVVNFIAAQEGDVR